MKKKETGNDVRSAEENITSAIYTFTEGLSKADQIKVYEIMADACNAMAEAASDELEDDDR